MNIRPDKEDLKLICSYTGKVLSGVGILLAVPLATALVCGEWSSAVDFFLSLCAILSVGGCMVLAGETKRRATWMHGMVTAGISWLVVMATAALPYWLSGQYIAYLDCMFDVMSGFTTTGLALIQNLDHTSNSLNMWRHLITFVGGQGVIVLALSFLVKDSSGGYKLYVGEGKDERLFPSVFHTARAIWKISLVYLAFGTLAFFLSGLAIGLPFWTAFLHGLWMYMSAWSTGGFAPMSQNLLYYHSGLFEITSFVFFVIGSFNFALHHAIWSGDRREMFRNIESVSFTVSLGTLTLLCCSSLMRAGVYPDIISLFRKGFFQIVSAHTTTGLMTIYPRQFALEWGDVALLGTIIAMLIGGSACSTAGGFKGLRVGILWKAIVQETRRMLKPGTASFTQSFHYLGEKSLGERQVRSAALIVILYLVTFGAATIAGTLCGYSLTEAAFESASVTGNVGLSIGVTSASMPAALKIVYILVMWAGRLEFMAVLATFGFLAALLGKGRKRR